MDKILFEKLYNSLRNNPKEWYHGDEFRIEHKKTEIAIWVANGKNGMQIDRPVSFKEFGWWQRRKLWKLVEPIAKIVKDQKKRQDLEVLTRIIEKL